MTLRGEPRRPGGPAGLGVVLAAWLAGCAPAPAPRPPDPGAPAPLPVAPVAPPRDDLVAVLPGPDGHAGSVSVTHAGQDILLQGPFAGVRIRAVGRLEPGPVSPEEVRAVFGEVLAALPAPPVTFTLHFLEGSDEFTPDSGQLVQQVLAEIAARPAPEVTVIGHTDRVGSVAYNDVLSLQRAERVQRELVRLGVPPERIAIAGRGEREPVVPTADEVPEARNRRVEISVR